MRSITKLGLITISLAAAFAINIDAALISRTYTYTSGNTIVANENNTNENTLYTEINGNLNSANILDGGVTTADLADNSVTAAKLESPITISSSTITNLTVSTITATFSNITGTIRQFGYVTNATSTGGTSSTFTTTALAKTFTTLKAGSTVYILVTGDASIASVSGVSCLLTIKRDTTDLASGSTGFTSFLSINGQTVRVPVAMFAKDIPGAVGSYVYKVFIRNTDNATSVLFPSGNAVDTSMFIIEVF